MDKLATPACDYLAAHRDHSDRVQCHIRTPPQCKNEVWIKGEDRNVSCDDPRAPNDLPPVGPFGTFDIQGF